MCLIQHIGIAMQLFEYRKISEVIPFLHAEIIYCHQIHNNYSLFGFLPDMISYYLNVA